MKKNKLISITKAAKLLGVHSETLRRWDRHGIFKAIIINNRGDRRYKLSEVIDRRDFTGILIRQKKKEVRLKLLEPTFQNNLLNSKIINTFVEKQIMSGELRALEDLACSLANKGINQINGQNFTLTTNLSPHPKEKEEVGG